MRYRLSRSIHCDPVARVFNVPELGWLHNVSPDSLLLETDEGLTHVFYDNYMPPSRGYGWSSLCNAVQLPIEGEHFELNEDVTEEDIMCEHCRKRLGSSHVDLDDESIALVNGSQTSKIIDVNGCLARFNRNEDGVIIGAKRLCRGVLHHSLLFEPDSFTGNLEEQVEDVCSECWETYVDHQWDSDEKGAELRVEVGGEDSRSEYFAARTEAVRGVHEAALRLVSENGLTKKIPREEINSITLTPARRVIH